MFLLKIPTPQVAKMIVFADPVTAPWLVANQLVDEMLRLDQRGGSSESSPLQSFLTVNPGASVYLKGSNADVVTRLVKYLWSTVTSDQADRISSYVQVQWDAKTRHLMGRVSARDYVYSEYTQPRHLSSYSDPGGSASTVAYELLLSVFTWLEEVPVSVRNYDNYGMPKGVTFSVAPEWTWAVPLPGRQGAATRIEDLRFDDPTEIEPLVWGIWPGLSAADVAKIAGYVVFHWTNWVNWVIVQDQIKAEADATSATVAADGGSSMADPSSPDAIEASAPWPESASASANPIDAIPNGDPHGTPKLPPELVAIDFYLNHLVNQGVSIDVAAKLAVKIWKEAAVPAACFPSLPEFPENVYTREVPPSAAAIWPPQMTLADIVQGQHRYPGASHPVGWRGGMAELYGVPSVPGGTATGGEFNEGTFGEITTSPTSGVIQVSSTGNGTDY
jgi:hypothetical protein